MKHKHVRDAWMALLTIILAWNGFGIGLAAGYRLAPGGVDSPGGLLWPFFGALTGVVSAMLIPVVIRVLVVALANRLPKARFALVVFLSFALPWPGMLLGEVVGYILGWRIEGAMIGASVGFLAPWLVAVVISAFQSKERAYEQG